MVDFKAIYGTQAAMYDRLVSREDYQGNLLRALRRIRPPDGVDVIELGAGTGRITRLLAPLAKRIVAGDASPHMLGVAAERLKQDGLDNWRLAVADNRALPFACGVADIAVAGWSLGHAQDWYPDSWRGVVDTVVSEMLRVLKPCGTAIIIETLGTGREMPQPPHEGLTAYYAWLEGEHDFASAWIRTDYQFESVEEAETLFRFFFGDLADIVVEQQLTIVPECTGIWWRTA
jgi:ubiquinone/menaquinone biosynthesis C-methylase UbiE